jgi:hypothetical protein
MKAHQGEGSLTEEDRGGGRKQARGGCKHTWDEKDSLALVRALMRAWRMLVIWYRVIGCFRVGVEGEGREGAQ